MTPNEIRKMHVIQTLLDGNTTIKKAAMVLGLTERQIKRIKAGLKREGASFVIHKNTGRKPKHAITEATKEKIVELAKTTYIDFNHTHMQEMLAEHDGIHVSRSALNNLLRTSGLSSPQTHRASKRHPARPRMEQEGFLVQIDATLYEWWNEEKACLHGAIDDAAGKIVSLHFEPTECMDGYFTMLTNLVNKHGIPLAIYADRHTIFSSTFQRETLHR